MLILYFPPVSILDGRYEGAEEKQKCQKKRNLEESQERQL